MANQSGVEVWLTASEIASLLGVSLRTVQRHLEAGKYTTRRDETDGRGSYLVLLSSLPKEAMKAWADSIAAERKQQAVAAAPSANPFAAQPIPAPAVVPAMLKKPRRPPHAQETGEEYRLLWAAYEKRGSKIKRRAELALVALDDFFKMTAGGVPVATAEKAVEGTHGVGRVTLWRYRTLVDGHPRHHWLPLLAPRYVGQGKEAEFTEAAYEWILARHLTTSQTKVSVLVRLAREEGKGKDWIIPSVKTVQRRLAAEPAPLVTLGREGPKALEASFPTVEKDYTTLKLHELWESDGRRLDLMVLWPDGSIGRPFVVVWRELRTRLVLSAKGYKDPCGELVMVSFRDAIENCGCLPRNLKIDNGREYANKPFTGQQKTRYRFKVNPFEPVGVATHMGIEASWSPPGRGRDKPIESFWRWIADNLDKRPEFEGAYVGRNPVEKPENFDRRKAVPIALVNRLLADALHQFNTAKPHRGSGMHNRTPQAVYEELLPLAKAADELRAPDPAHLRLLLMAVKTLKPGADDAVFEFEIEGYGRRRYWSKAFWQQPASVRARKFAVWYHPDNPAAPVAIYDCDVHVCDCPPLDGLPFTGAGEAAATHVKAKNEALKPAKSELKRLKSPAAPALPAPDDIFPPLSIPRPAAAPMIEPRQRPPEPSARIVSPEIQERNARLEEEQRARREAEKAARRPRYTPEELEAMEREQREKREAERKKRFG